MPEEYKGTLLGLIYTVSCLVLYYTFIIPLLLMLPLSLTLETFFSNIYKEEGYSKIGNSVMFALLAIFLTVFVFFFTYFIYQIRTTNAVKTSRFLLFLTLQLFIIHPLVFYFDLSKDWSRAEDGQFFFSINSTFQLSSIPFVFLGIVLDFLKFILSNTATNTAQKSNAGDI